MKIQTAKENIAILPEQCLSVNNATREIILLKAGESGSMFGWEKPAANPDYYDEDGKKKQ